MTTRNGTGTRATGEALGQGYGWYAAYDWDGDGAPRATSTASSTATAARAHREPTTGAAVSGPTGSDGRAPAPVEEERAGRVGLSLAQIGGSAAAAVSAAVVAGKLGVAGTLIGAAVASVVSTICAAYYTSFASGAHQRVRRLSAQAPTLRPRTVRTGGPHDGDRRDTSRRSAGAAPRPRLRRWWVGALATFVLAIGAITVLELGLGHPVSASENSGTSVGNVLQAPATQERPSGPATTPAAPGASTPTGGSTPTDVPTGSATAPVPSSDGAATPDPRASASVPALNSAEPSPPQATAPAR